MSKNTREKMEGRNVVFSKEGLKVGVKELRDEDYRDRSQRFVFSCFPGRFSNLARAIRLTLVVSS